MKGKFATLSTPCTSEPKRQVALYPWDDGNPEWEDLDEDVDETVARDIDELNGDTVNLMRISEDERDRQMKDYTHNAHRNNYLRAASVQWRKICATYRAKAKSLRKKLSFLNRRGFDENGDFAPMKLCSRFSYCLREVSYFVVVNVAEITNYLSRNSKMKSRHRVAIGTMRTISSRAWKLRYSSTGHIGCRTGTPLLISLALPNSGKGLMSIIFSGRSKKQTHRTDFGLGLHGPLSRITGSIIRFRPLRTGFLFQALDQCRGCRRNSTTGLSFTLRKLVLGQILSFHGMRALKRNSKYQLEELTTTMWYL